MAIHVPMAASTANWHWKNKNVTGWSKTWFEQNLTTISVKENGTSASISTVSDVEGDVELGQRKSKLITIYDCRVSLKWEGEADDGTKAKGKLIVPEVSHEITLDGLSDYAYEWSLSTDSTPEVEKIFSLARNRLPSLLAAKFKEFPAVLTEVHGRDLQVSGTPTETSRVGTPAPVDTATTSAKVSERQEAARKFVRQQMKTLNTETVTVKATFMAPADELYNILTDESRIPMWTRAPAQSKPEPGASFSLFGGGVKGTYESVEPGKKIVQKWALSSPTWPEGHFATLTITLDQSTDSTSLVFSLDGVPTGMQDEIKRNMEGYYVQGLKSIGLGSQL